MHLPHLLSRFSESAPTTTGSRRFTALLCAALLLLAALPALAGSPFATGANAAQSNVLAILTPVAAIAVMGSGALAWFGRISWLWFIGAIIGTVLVFGAPQIVAWIRSMFGV
jgi:type IV secretion system protein VirB2